MLVADLSSVDLVGTGAWIESQFDAGINVEFIATGTEPDSLDLLLLLRQAAARGVDPPANQPEAIGRYRILRLAGRGGFSVVWEAFDPLLRRRVAVKACTSLALRQAPVSPGSRTHLPARSFPHRHDPRGG